MERDRVEVMLEDLYHLVETVAEGVGANSRRLDLLAAEVEKLKENQARSEMLLQRLEGEVTAALRTETPLFRVEKFGT